MPVATTTRAFKVTVTATNQKILGPNMHRRGLIFSYCSGAIAFINFNAPAADQSGITLFSSGFGSTILMYDAGHTYITGEVHAIATGNGLFAVTEIVAVEGGLGQR